MLAFTQIGHIYRWSSWKQKSQLHNLLLSLFLKVTCSINLKYLIINCMVNYLSSYRKCQLSDDPDIIYNFWVHSTSNGLTYHWRCSEQCKRVYIKDFVVLPWTSFLQDAGHASNCRRKLYGGNVPKWTWYKLDVLYLHCCIIKITMLSVHLKKDVAYKNYTHPYIGVIPRVFVHIGMFSLKRVWFLSPSGVKYSIVYSLRPFIFNYPIPFVQFWSRMHFSFHCW